MENLSQDIDEFIGGDENLQIQLNKAANEMSLLLDMINLKLGVSNRFCQTYTLTIASKFMGSDGYKRH